MWSNAVASSRSSPGPLIVPDPRGAVAAGHRPGDRDQPGDRAGDPPGDPRPVEQREQGGEPGRARDRPQQRGAQHFIGGAEAGRGQADKHRAHPLAP